MKLLTAVTVAQANAALFAQETIPEQGLVIWSIKLGNYYEWYYILQVRVLPDHKYRVVSVHRSGHVNPSYGDHEFLEDSLVEAFRGYRDYHQADAEYREDAARFYDQEMLKCA